MNKAIQTLEFNKIKERLSEFCQSSLGKQLVDKPISCCKYKSSRN